MRQGALLSLSVATVLSCCASVQLPSSAIPEGEYLGQQLLGTWCPLESDGQSCAGHEEYRNDKTFRSCGPDEKLNGGLFQFAFSYKVSGRRICFSATESNDLDRFPIGSDFCVEVVELTAAVFRYRFDGERITYTSRRMPSGTPSCPTISNPKPNSAAHR